jgi:hypothetical protein
MAAHVLMSCSDLPSPHSGRLWRIALRADMSPDCGRGFDSRRLHLRFQAKDGSRQMLHPTSAVTPRSSRDGSQYHHSRTGSCNRAIKTVTRASDSVPIRDERVPDVVVPEGGHRRNLSPRPGSAPSELVQDSGGAEFGLAGNPEHPVGRQVISQRVCTAVPLGCSGGVAIESLAVEE